MVPIPPYSRLVATEIPKSLIRGLAENPVQNCALFLFINHQNVEEEGGSDAESISSETSIRESTRFDTVEEVADAIDACKEAILQTRESTAGRMDMVLRLIQLRIRFEDMNERANATVTKLEKSTFYQSSFETMGHVFITYQDIKHYVPGVTNEKDIYCQQCGYEIITNHQSSQHCQDCGFSVHSSCLDDITRTCLALKIRTQTIFMMEICPEKTLLGLNYRCAECHKQLKPKTQLAFGNVDIDETEYTGPKGFTTIIECMQQLIKQPYVLFIFDLF